MKVAWKMDETGELYDSAAREATAALGRGECFVEQFVDRPRHVEAQVIAGVHGLVVVLGTRDCSLQRRNQKLVEEAPRAGMQVHAHRAGRLSITVAKGTHVMRGTLLATITGRRERRLLKAGAAESPRFPSRLIHLRWIEPRSGDRDYAAS